MSRASDSWGSGPSLEWRHGDIRAAVIFRHGKAGEPSQPRFSILRGSAFHRVRVELNATQAIVLAHWMLDMFEDRA